MYPQITTCRFSAPRRVVRDVKNNRVIKLLFIYAENAQMV